MTRRQRSVLVAAPAILVITAAAIGPILAPHAADEAVGIPFSPPSADAWFGTDHLGHDVLSQLLFGGWGLMTVAVVIAVSVTTLAAVIGTTAALRPRIGSGIERSTDALMLVPPVLAIMLVMLSWPGSGTWGLILIAVVVGTPYSARVFAAAASGIAATGYVEVAIASGENLPYLVAREVLPNLRDTVTTQLGLRFVEAVYLVSTAAFLQLPASLGETNWALMVRENGAGILLNPWSVAVPSLAIGILAVSTNLAIRAFGADQGRVRA